MVFHWNVITRSSLWIGNYKQVDLFIYYDLDKLLKNEFAQQWEIAGQIVSF